jgi:hypothetical protein
LNWFNIETNLLDDLKKYIKSESEFEIKETIYPVRHSIIDLREFNLMRKKLNPLS